MLTATKLVRNQSRVSNPGLGTMDEAQSSRKSESSSSKKFHRHEKQPNSFDQTRPSTTSSSQWTDEGSRRATTFKFGTKKAKKSLNAIILASGPAASIAVPSFFSVISKLRFRPAPKNHSASSSKATNTPGPSSRTRTSGSGALDASRRAQSLYILPQDVSSTAASSPPELTSRNSFTQRSSCSSPDEIADRLKVLRYPYLPPLPFEEPTTVAAANRRQPLGLPIHASVSNGWELPSPVSITSSSSSTERNISPRRIQSEPSTVLKQCEAATTDNSGAMKFAERLLADRDDDTDGIDLEEWFVPSVKAKAQKRKDHCQEILEARSQPRMHSSTGSGDLTLGKHSDVGVETWDDDFELEDEAGSVAEPKHLAKDAGYESLRIPTSIKKTQTMIKTDINNVRKFALHIEDMKLLYDDVKIKADGLRREAEFSPFVSELDTKYGSQMEKVKVLVDLAQYADDSEASRTIGSESDALGPPGRHIQVFATIMDEIVELVGTCSLEDSDPFSTLGDVGRNVSLSTTRTAVAWDEEDPFLHIDDEDSSAPKLGASPVFMPGENRDSFDSQPTTLQTRNPAALASAAKAAAAAAKSVVQGESEKLLFGVELVPALIPYMSLLKHSLNEYSASLRQIVLESSV
ncbi:hypothetical protein BJ742DRAFT_855982 [Cladochytrium replicatum]|nr:hypothetical protein BJ742DRAFT_855982 [Cladochytrium replicatum]